MISVSSKPKRFSPVLAMFAAAIALVASGCSTPGALSVDVSKSLSEFSPQSIAVMTLSGDPAFPLTNLDLHQKTVALVDALSGEVDQTISNVSCADKVSKAEADLKQMPYPPRAKAVELGKKVSADAVVYGEILEFFEPPNARGKAAEGASAAFKLWLVDVKTGKLLWSAMFDKENAPISENLLLLPTAMKDGIRYRTVDELLADGFRQAARSLAGALRE